MASLILRLAAPVQTWGTYRASAPGVVPTLPVPTKTGVAGLIAACLGHPDPTGVIDAFTLHVRADRTNAFETDLQVASNIAESHYPAIRRAESVRLGSPVAPARQITGGSQPGKYDRDFVPHAEFLIALTAPADLVETWHTAARQPVFMPYLGRRANAPAFPFVLGITDLTATDLFETAPRVARHDEDPADPASVRCYAVEGDFSTLPAPTYATPPVVASREEYLTWFAQNLTR